MQIRVPVLEDFFQVAPAGDVAGKFSYQFTVASALLDGQVTKWTFARVPDISSATILRFLDRGMMGIQGPRVKTSVSRRP